MAKYLPTKVSSRPQQDGNGTQPSPPSPSVVTRNLVTGYQWNNGNSLSHEQMDANWGTIDVMQQGGKSWPKYDGLYLKNVGLDTEGGIFVDNPYNNSGVTPFGVNYVNYRLDYANIQQGDSDFGVTLAEGDFLSYSGNLNLKNGDVRYGTTLSFVDSDTSNYAMTLTGTNVYVGAGSTANPNTSQVRIGKLGGTQVDIGALDNILNQEVTLQVGASGSTSITSKSGSIKAKQTQVSPPLWNLTLNSYNGTTNVEALTIAPDGAVTIPSLVGAGPDYDSAKINNLTSPGLVNLGSVGGANTIIKGDLQVDGSIIGGGVGVGVTAANLATVSPAFSVSQLSNTGAVTMNIDVAPTFQVPLVTEVTSWNNLVGTGGGAAQADQLTTSRLIWGRPFNGTADITGALSNVTSVSSSGADLDFASTAAMKFTTPSGEYTYTSNSTNIGIVKFVGLTAQRTYDMPNKSGIVAMISDVEDGHINLDSDNIFTVNQTFSGGLTGDLTGNADTATTASNASALNNVTASITDNAKIVLRDGNGDFTAGTISANLSGTASNASFASDAGTLNGVTASTTTNGTIVLRDASGDFTAGTITATLDGNASSVTNGVTTNTVQTITGEKTFSSTVNVSERISFNGNNAAVLTQAASGQTMNFIVNDYSTTNPILTLGDLGAGLGIVGYMAAPFLVGGNLAATGDGQINGTLNVASGLSVTGAITATGDITAYFTSDERLKDNITPIPNALDKVASLSGNTFDWNDKTDKVGSETGVIAQEVQALGLPDVVTERDNGYLAVRYEKLVPLLIEAIKELKAEVEELKA